MVILACKSDPDAVLQVNAGQGNELGEPFNVGLIEVTALTSGGKSKMRNGFRWLLYKLEQKMRKFFSLVTASPSFAQLIKKDACRQRRFTVVCRQMT
jgi:hypothetical protein